MENINPSDDLFKLGCQLAKTIPHDAFVQMVKSKEIVYEILLKNQYKLLNKGHKIAFSSYVVMYYFVPFIVLSILAYSYSNWYTLFGVAVSFLGSYLGAKESKLPFLLTIICLGWWTSDSFHLRSYPMFYLVCLWWGYMWFHIASTAETEYAKYELLTDPDLYYNLAENEKLFILMKPEAIGKNPELK